MITLFENLFFNYFRQSHKNYIYEEGSVIFKKIPYGKKIVRPKLLTENIVPGKRHTRKVRPGIPDIYS